MRKQPLALLLGALVLALSVGAGVSVAAGAAGDSDPQAVKPDDLEHPLGKEQRELRAKALEAKAQGKIKAGTKVAKVAKGQYVELEQEGNDRVFVIIAEFGESIHATHGGTPGPLHNQIAQPNRANDNTTIWQADFNKAHYENMYFTKMVDYYKAQSSGRYTINGDVIDWVKVPYNEARYGSNYCGSNVCATTWLLIRDAVDKWYADKIAGGMMPAEAQAYLDSFDVNDRYDYDGDSRFNESDGYIDHFQIVHAGEGEETGGGAQGPNAIWSHRWYTFYNGIGSTGPAFNRAGGEQIGASSTWIGDYTIQPENGGLGVFAHEYAHDLGLPDQYDTAGGENSPGFWTIMPSGSYLGDGTTDLGSAPGDFNAWEKFQLGWLNYEVAFAGRKSEHKLGPAEFNTKQAQGLFVVLPDKEVIQTIASPSAGSKFYYSGAGDDVDNSMTRSVALPAGTVSLAAQVNYQIELDWDYAYLTVNGVPVATNLSTASNPNGQNFGNGITGVSSGWTALTADLSAYAGQTVTLGFRYWTDVAVTEPGFMVDELAITGQPTDGAETAAGWTFDGFKVTTGTETGHFFNAYVVENRAYVGYDKGLKTGPYNFGFLNTKPDWVEHFPYQDGILISYWDSFFTDNNTSQHSGGGLILPIDAHPNALLRPDSTTPWRSRVQSYDATFGLQPTDAIQLHVNGEESNIPSLPAVPVFNDDTDFWDTSTPLANVQTPNTGTKVRVKSITPGGFAQIEVR